MGEQPTGTVTLLFTDIEGSTRLLERLGPERYRESLELHRRLLREAFERHGGYEVDSEGDAFFAAFGRAGDAVAAAAEGQQGLAAAKWPEGLPVRVRMGIHTGEPLPVPPKYVGLDVHKAARIMAAGHGGQVLLSVATRQLLDPATPLAQLGEHRLKDLSQPEPLFQLCVAGLPAEFPALKTLNTRTNLPIVATPFVGREQEVADVVGLLRLGGVRLVTLTGPGGVGKTRLALQAAAELTDDFTDGVYWAPLAPIRDSDLVIDGIAEQFRLREEVGVPMRVTLGRYLLERELLLVVDNFEHLIGAAEELAGLLAAAPRLALLVTSREALRVSGENLFDVPPLELPEPAEAKRTSIEGNESVQLFATRAKAADHAFAVTDDNAAAIAALVRKLDGLPLAIELAAARVRALPPAALNARLSNRLHLLTSGRRDADARQRTLVATIQWSYDLLTEDEQTLFARLSVFVGGFRTDTSEQVCDPDLSLGIGVFDGIVSLLDKSLLRRRVDSDGEPRYWMLEAIREFASERLHDAGAELVMRRRHAEAIATEAAQMSGNLGGVPDSRFEAEHPNIRAALTFAEEVDDAALYVRLVDATGQYWYLYGHVTEGVARAKRAVAFAQHLDDSEQAAALQTLTHLQFVNGEPAEAVLPLAERSLRLAERIGDTRRLLWALDMKAQILGSVSDPEADALLQRCLTLAKENGETWFEMVCRINLSNSALRSGRYQEAASHAAESVAAARALNDDGAVCAAMANHGSALLALGQFSEAAPLLEEALRRADRYGYAEPLAWAAVGLATIASQRGDPTSATVILGYVHEVLATNGYALRGFEEQRQQTVLEEARRLLEPATLQSSLERGANLARAHRIDDLITIGIP